MELALSPLPQPPIFSGILLFPVLFFSPERVYDKSLHSTLFLFPKDGEAATLPFFFFKKKKTE